MRIAVGQGIRWLLVLGLAATLAAGTAARVDGGAAPNGWEGSPLPGGVSQMFQASSGTLFVSVHMDHPTIEVAYRSTDGAVTWEPVPLPDPVGTQSPPSFRTLEDHTVLLAVNPLDARVLYARGDQGLYRTDDGGASWRLILNLDTEDHLWQLEVGAADTNVLYGVVTKPYPVKGYQLWVSEDSGVSWEMRIEELTDEWVGTVHPDPRDPQRVFLATECFIAEVACPAGYRFRESTDTGRTWTTTYQPQREGIHVLVGGAGANPARWYFRSDGPSGGRCGFVGRSDDDGRTWTHLLESFKSGALAYDPSHPDTVFAGDGAGRVYASDDSGESWSVLGDPGRSVGGELQISPDGRYLYATADPGVWRIDLVNARRTPCTATFQRDSTLPRCNNASL